MRLLSHIVILFAFLAVWASPGDAETQKEGVRSDQKIHKSHAFSIRGTPKYGPDFEHFDYTNPDAPKGGELRLNATGTYNTLNPYTLKGVPAPGGGVFETLTIKSEDEPGTVYGLIAKSMEWPEDRSWVIFNLRKNARWHDGKPITAEDVVFSFNTVTKEGHPYFRVYYGNVAKAEILNPHRVKFTFSGPKNPELPLIVGELPVVPKHYWQDKDFAETTLDPPLGSGPYKVGVFEPGRYIVFERVDDYWGKDLAPRRGQDNFQRIRYDYYRDQTVALEAFKAGEYDFRLENVSKNWATAYNFPAVRDNLVIKEEIPHKIPQGMQAFAFNIRKPMFKNRRVREALNYAFNFEFTNKTLFYGQYTRSESYFSNSELAARQPISEREKEILEPFRGQVPDEVFTTVYEAPRVTKQTSIRDNLITAMKMLREEGYVIEDGKLINTKTKEPFEFEILLNSPSFERIVLPFKKNLKRLGIDVRIRTVDLSQYEYRMENFDFDMVVVTIPQSASPGNEQRDFWTSDVANVPGSRNLVGIQNPVVDELVEGVIASETREELKAYTRALDRVLLWNHYVIPQWHIRMHRIAYWNKFGRPKIVPEYGLGLDAWWIDRKKVDKLESLKSGMKR